MAVNFANPPERYATAAKAGRANRGYDMNPALLVVKPRLCRIYDAPQMTMSINQTNNKQQTKVPSHKQFHQSPLKGSQTNKTLKTVLTATQHRLLGTGAHALDSGPLL